MVHDMKTTLNIHDSLVARLKREAARRGRAMSDLVEEALSLLFRSPKEKRDLPPLQTFHGGEELVDISDRDALYHAMEGR